MKAVCKFYHRYMDSFLLLAAILLGMLIMVLQKPVATQASLPVPMSQTFLGEYSYDGVNWNPLEADTELSARNGDLYLRGHFEHEMRAKTRLYFFCDHVGSQITVNGKLYAMDIILELDNFDVKMQPSMCSREWNFCYFEEAVPTDALVEIHIKNPHRFGNRNAYQYFLETLCCTPNEQEFLAQSLAAVMQPYRVVGIMLAIVGVLLLCAVPVSIFLHAPVENAVMQTGLLAVLVGGYFLLDTIDLSFRSENHIVNTYGWQICIMYSVYLLGTMARDLLEGKRKIAATWVMAISAVVDVALILASFAGTVLMYDTLRVWVILQGVICPVLVVCCAGELIYGRRQKVVELIAFLLVFGCIAVDCTGIPGSLYSHAMMTKAAVLLLFLVKMIQFVRNILLNFKASSRARKLEKELEEKRIAIMLSQIQPHFIFNVLGTIRGLCRENPEEAWRGLGDFSAYLRANMNALTNTKSIPFEMELAHVEAYLRLEKMRMGEKLNVVYDIQEKEFSIPPLLLQPLVENAVKHGLFYKPDGGTVTIRSVRKDRNIIVSVHDDGIGFEEAAKKVDFERSEHLGLENVRSRVEKMLGGSVRIDSRPEHGSTVTLEFAGDNHG